MYDLPYEMQYELYSDMGKHFYWGSYTIAVKTPQNLVGTGSSKISVI